MHGELAYSISNGNCFLQAKLWRFSLEYWKRYTAAEDRCFVKWRMDCNTSKAQCFEWDLLECNAELAEVLKAYEEAQKTYSFDFVN